MDKFRTHVFHMIPNPTQTFDKQIRRWQPVLDKQALAPEPINHHRPELLIEALAIRIWAYHT